MKFALALCLVALVGSAVSAPAKSKVSLVLQRQFLEHPRVNIFITMKDGISSVLDSVAQNTFATRGEQATAVFNALNAHAAESQKSVLAALNSPLFFNIKVQSFWITNQVYVQGADKYTVESIAAMDEVASIEEEAIVYLDEPTVADPEQPGVLAEWGVEIIQAPAAWAASDEGQNAVAGVIDTGARSTHEAIRDNYRGGTHSWYNPYSQTQTPGDGHGHGTHCTGTIAGKLGIGVAPQAKWISCKGLNDQGSGTQAALLACGQFMACPHTYNGQNPNCALAPHVVSNSWGGGSGANWYDGVINTWKASNIIPVFANGNSGSSCGSANSPADSAAGAISVGATTSTDAIASFSSRGPNSFNQQSPVVSAPGNGVRSAGHTSDTAYTSMSGTSMACPHVAGLVSLLKSRTPNASYATIKAKLESTADRGLSFGNQVCGGVSERDFPNHTFGFGRINALNAVRAP